MAAVRKAIGGNATAAVLWLMIALVFLPIVAIHVGARIASRVQSHAQVDTEHAAEPASHS